MTAPPRPQLGRLMVDAGLITDAQLAEALAEQARTGAQLGHVVVDLGFASGAAVANALASQEGRALATEYGIALGLSKTAPDDGTPLTMPPVSSTGRASAPPKPAVPEPVPEPPAPPAPDVDHDRRELAEQAAALDRRAEELVASVRRIAELETKVARLETELADARDALPDPAVTEQLHTELGRLRRENGSLREELERTRAAAADRDAALERVAALEAAQPPRRRRTGEAHDLLVPTSDGYRLLRRDGPAPESGARVEIRLADGAEPRILAVARVSTPPGGTTCAYLADV